MSMPTLLFVIVLLEMVAVPFVTEIPHKPDALPPL